MYEQKQITYTGPTGVTVPVNCDWCGSQATKAISVGPGRGVGTCDQCESKARRFHASVTPELRHSSVFKGTAWQPSKERPDLVIHRAGENAITIMDQRQLNAKALKGLLPPAKIKRTRKSRTKIAEAKPATVQLASIARRYKRLERELRALLDNPEGLNADEIAATVGIDHDQLAQVAA